MPDTAQNPPRAPLFSLEPNQVVDALDRPIHRGDPTNPSWLNAAVKGAVVVNLYAAALCLHRWYAPFSSLQDFTALGSGIGLGTIAWVVIRLFEAPFRSTKEQLSARGVDVDRIVESARSIPDLPSRSLLITIPALIVFYLVYISLSPVAIVNDSAASSVPCGAGFFMKAYKRKSGYASEAPAAVTPVRKCQVEEAAFSATFHRIVIRPGHWPAGKNVKLQLTIANGGIDNILVPAENAREVFDLDPKENAPTARPQIPLTITGDLLEAADRFICWFTLDGPPNEKVTVTADLISSGGTLASSRPLGVVMPDRDPSGTGPGAMPGR